MLASRRRLNCSYSALTWSKLRRNNSRGTFQGFLVATICLRPLFMTRKVTSSSSLLRWALDIFSGLVTCLHSLVGKGEGRTLCFAGVGNVLDLRVHGTEHVGLEPLVPQPGVHFLEGVDGLRQLYEVVLHSVASPVRPGFGLHPQFASNYPQEIMLFFYQLLTAALAANSRFFYWAEHPLFTGGRVYFSEPNPLPSLNGAFPSRIVNYPAAYASLPSTMLSVQQLSLGQLQSLQHRYAYKIDLTTPSSSSFTLTVNYNNAYLFAITVRYMSYSPTQLIAGWNIRALVQPVIVTNLVTIGSMNSNINQVVKRVSSSSTINYNTQQFSSIPRIFLTIIQYNLATTVALASLGSVPLQFGVDCSSLNINTINTAFNVFVTGTNYTLLTFRYMAFVISLIDVFPSSSVYGLFVNYTYTASAAPAFEATRQIQGVNYQGLGSVFLSSFYSFVFSGMGRISYSATLTPGTSQVISAFNQIGAANTNRNFMLGYTVQFFLPIIKSCYNDAPNLYGVLCYEVCPEGLAPTSSAYPSCMSCAVIGCKSFTVSLTIDYSLPYPRTFFTLTLDFSKTEAKFPPFSITDESKTGFAFYPVASNNSAYSAELIVNNNGTTRLTFCFASVVAFQGVYLNSSCYTSPPARLERPAFDFDLAVDTHVAIANSYYLLFKEEQYLKNLSSPSFLTVLVNGSKAEYSYFLLNRSFFFQVKPLKDCVLCNLTVLMDNTSVITFVKRYPLEFASKSIVIPRQYSSDVPGFFSLMANGAFSVFYLLQNLHAFAFLLGFDCHAAIPLQTSAQLYLLSRNKVSLHYLAQQALNATSVARYYFVPMYFSNIVTLLADQLKAQTSHYLYFNHLYESLIPIILVWGFILLRMALVKLLYSLVNLLHLLPTTLLWKLVFSQRLASMSQLDLFLSAKELLFFFILRQARVEFSFDLSLLWEGLVSALFVQVLFFSAFVNPTFCGVHFKTPTYSFKYGNLFTVFSKGRTPFTAVYIRILELGRAAGLALAIFSLDEPSLQAGTLVAVQLSYFVLMLPNRVHLRNEVLFFGKETLLLALLLLMLGVAKVATKVGQTQAESLGFTQVVLVYALQLWALCESLGYLVLDWKELYQVFRHQQRVQFKRMVSQNRGAQSEIEERGHRHVNIAIEEENGESD